MIRPGVFLDWFSAAGISVFVGVPDSLLRSVSIALEEQNHAGLIHHVIAANEGAAVGYAVGSFLESGNPVAVYMQNSGLGNAVNPLTALAHHKVYGSPMVLIIGWRGEPGKHDEPQHVVQGAITRELLNVMGIRYVVLSTDEVVAAKQVSKLLDPLRHDPQPVAILVQAKTFIEEASQLPVHSALPLSREDGLRLAVEKIPSGARTIATTGMLGRELSEIREQENSPASSDFMVVGGMGHASAIAHGVAERSPQTPVWCLDGDGSLLMHLGSVAVIGNYGPKNLKHVLFNNFVHDSVGGQPTSIRNIKIGELATALGDKWVGSGSNEGEVRKILHDLSVSEGPAMVEVQIRTGARSNLGRPPTNTFTPGKRFPVRDTISPS